MPGPASLIVSLNRSQRCSLGCWCYLCLVPGMQNWKWKFLHLGRRTQGYPHSSGQCASWQTLLYFYWLLGYCQWPKNFVCPDNTTDWQIKHTPSWGHELYKSGMPIVDAHSKVLMKPSGINLLIEPALPLLLPGSMVRPNMASHSPFQADHKVKDFMFLMHRLSGYPQVGELVHS